MLEKKTRNTEANLPYLSPHINSATAGLKTELTPTLPLPSPSAADELDYLAAYQGTKVKPFDCVVIAQQVYLPALRHHLPFTCTARCQEEGPVPSAQAAGRSAGFFPIS